MKSKTDVIICDCGRQTSNDLTIWLMNQRINSVLALGGDYVTI